MYWWLQRIWGQALALNLNAIVVVVLLLLVLLFTYHYRIFTFFFRVSIVLLWELTVLRPTGTLNTVLSKTVISKTVDWNFIYPIIIQAF